MKRKVDDMEIVWQTPANPPERHDYIFRDGVRYVRPYYFEFICHVKNRWAGKTIVDLFTDEFKGRPRDYYVSAVKAGRIQVDGQNVPVSYVVKSSQKMSHFLHRHEPPVMAWDVEILHTEADVMTVCKPASVPVHPCGQYRKNTVIGILQAEHDLAPLFRIISAVHRLDRLVSGLLILARNASRADLFRQQICLDVIEGLRLDLEKSRYENFDELYRYCCCVAGVAGPMIVAVLGVAPESKISIENVYNATVKLGIATQLTNLLRDVGEDARMGRIYIPQDELARAGLSDEDIFRGKVTDKWRSFMRAQIQRARAYFDGAENGLDGVHSAGRWGFWASLLIYKQTLDAIEANDYDNFRKRASVGIAKKLITLPMAYAKANNPSFNWLIYKHA